MIEGSLNHLVLLTTFVLLTLLVCTNFVPA
jgi:hypothetical protein